MAYKLPLRDEAISAVAEILYARYPGLSRGQGQRDEASSRSDIHHHLEHLEAALSTGESVLFTLYARWLKDVFDNRKLPTQQLRDAFELIGGFYTPRLPAEQGAKLTALLAAAQQALGENTPPPQFATSRAPSLQAATNYGELALAGNHQGAEAVMQATMAAGCSLSEAAVRLIQPAMYEVGRLWQANRITVTQEHLATAISQDILAHAYMQADFAPPNGRTAMFAAVAGNHHYLGLRMLSDAFETAGWDVIYLGPDVPLRDLLRQVDANHPEILCLSATLPSHLVTAQETMEHLRAHLGQRCPSLWLGGQATLHIPHLWQTLKADAWAADALHALEQVG